MQNQRNLFIRSARRGLTLIEIMVVIALLGVLGTVIAVNLTDALDDNELARIIEATPADMLSHVLVEEALKAGGEDNITALVVGVRK